MTTPLRHRERSRGTGARGGAQFRAAITKPASPGPALGMMVVLVLMLLTGCSFFSRTKNVIYSLDRVPGTSVAARGTPLGIETLELPPGIDRREIVVRKADHQLDVRSNELWSADLRELVLHTLAFDLASRMPDGMVVLPGETKPAAMRPIDIVFEELAAGPDQKLVLRAEWKLGGVAHREALSVDLASLGSKDVATGMSQALAQLADRIAATHG